MKRLHKTICEGVFRLSASGLNRIGPPHSPNCDVIRPDTALGTGAARVAEQWARVCGGPSPDGQLDGGSGTGPVICRTEAAGVEDVDCV